MELAHRCHVPLRFTRKDDHGVHGIVVDRIDVTCVGVHIEAAVELQLGLHPPHHPFRLGKAGPRRGIVQAVEDSITEQVLVQQIDLIGIGINRHGAIGGIGVANHARRSPVRIGSGPVFIGRRWGMAHQGSHQRGSRAGRHPLAHRSAHCRHWLVGNQLGRPGGPSRSGLGCPVPLPLSRLAGKKHPRGQQGYAAQHRYERPIAPRLICSDHLHFPSPALHLDS